MRESSYSRIMPTLKRSSTTYRRPSHALRPISHKMDSNQQEPMNDGKHERRRSTGIFSAFFGMPPTPRAPEKKSVYCQKNPNKAVITDWIQG